MSSKGLNKGSSRATTSNTHTDNDYHNQPSNSSSSSSTSHQHHTTTSSSNTNHNSATSHIYCKWHRQGTCHLGSACHFSHTIPSTERIGETLPTLQVEGRVGIVGNLRRPLMHSIILYASDPRVVNYSKNVIQRFCDAGIDVFAQYYLNDHIPTSSSPSNNTSSSLSSVISPSSLSNTTNDTPPDQQVIKPENLASIISSTHADYLVVIGDRNLRYDTLMARKQGKLFEMSVTERIKTCLETWIHQSGIVRDNTDGSSSNTSSNAAVSPSHSLLTTESEKIVNSMPINKLFDCLQKATGLSYAEDRLQRLKQTAQEIYDIRSRQNNTVLSNSKQNNLLSGTSTFSLSSGDQIMVEKLTKTQTGLVKLHKDFVEATKALRRTPIVHPKRSTSVPINVSSPVVTISSVSNNNNNDFPSLGLGKGILVSVNYNPNNELTAYLHNKNKDSINLTPMSSYLHARLTSLLEARLEATEQIGDILMETVGETASALWLSYLKEYITSTQENSNTSTITDAYANIVKHLPLTLPSIVTITPIMPNSTDSLYSYATETTKTETATAGNNNRTTTTSTTSTNGTSPTAITTNTTTTTDNVSTVSKNNITEEKKDEWSCATCTFLNPADLLRCTMCDHARPDNWYVPSKVSSGVSNKKNTAINTSSSVTVNASVPSRTDGSTGVTNIVRNPAVQPTVTTTTTTIVTANTKTAGKSVATSQITVSPTQRSTGTEIPSVSSVTNKRTTVAAPSVPTTVTAPRPERSGPISYAKIASTGLNTTNATVPVANRTESKPLISVSGSVSTGSNSVEATVTKTEALSDKIDPSQTEPVTVYTGDTKNTVVSDNNTNNVSTQVLTSLLGLSIGAKDNNNSPTENMQELDTYNPTEGETNSSTENTTTLPFTDTSTAMDNMSGTTLQPVLPSLLGFGSSLSSSSNPLSGSLLGFGDALSSLQTSSFLAGTSNSSGFAPTIPNTMQDFSFGLNLPNVSLGTIDNGSFINPSLGGNSGMAPDINTNNLSTNYDNFQNILSGNNVPKNNNGNNNSSNGNNFSSSLGIGMNPGSFMNNLPNTNNEDTSSYLLNNGFASFLSSGSNTMLMNNNNPNFNIPLSFDGTMNNNNSLLASSLLFNSMNSNMNPVLMNNSNNNNNNSNNNNAGTNLRSNPAVNNNYWNVATNNSNNANTNDMYGNNGNNGLPNNNQFLANSLFNNGNNSYYPTGIAPTTTGSAAVNNNPNNPSRNNPSLSNSAPPYFNPNTMNNNNNMNNSTNIPNLSNNMLLQFQAALLSAAAGNNNNSLGNNNNLSHSGGQNAQLNYGYLNNNNNTVGYTNNNNGITILSHNGPINNNNAMVKQPCQVCGQESVLSCALCDSEPPYRPTYYCSSEHQGIDYVQHRKYHEEFRRRIMMMNNNANNSM